MRRALAAMMLLTIAYLFDTLDDPHGDWAKVLIGAGAGLAAGFAVRLIVAEARAGRRADR